MKQEKAMAENRQKELRQALEVFRSTHPEKTLKREKALWRYRSGGSGKEAVMLLAGALGKGEAFFLHAARLEERFRVLIPDYPAAGVDELAEGLLEIMDREGVDACHLIAQSLGGLIAQELLCRAPGRMGNVVLSHTATVSADMAESELREIREGLMRTRRLLERVPLGLLKPLFKLKIGRMLVGKDPGETRFWKDYFSDLLDGLDKDRERALQSAMIEFVETRRYRPEDFGAWKGRMLIVQSNLDRAFEARQKEALSRLFPEGRRHVFEAGGHLALLFEREAFMALAMGHLTGIDGGWETKKEEAVVGIIRTESAYAACFSKIEEDGSVVRYRDEILPEMYSHNFTYIGKKLSLVEWKAVVASERALREKEGARFLRLETDGPLPQGFSEAVGAGAETEVYEYWGASVGTYKTLQARTDCRILEAVTEKVLADGMRVDVEANAPAMGEAFAKSRITRKAKAYESDSLLSLFVCYDGMGQAIGNCEFFLKGDTVKIEDFDILPEFQRKGYGTAVLRHLLRVAEERGAERAYLVTDKYDTAREMYRRCGFEKMGEKTILFFKW